VPVPVVIYAAKSTQDVHRSIETQFEDCRAKAEEEDWEVVGEFKDEKFSAYSGNRGKDLREAKDLAAEVAGERGEICMLLAQASDRFARGEGDKPGAADALIEIWHLLRRQNVHLRSVEDDGDLRDSPSVANLGHRAMMESKRKSGAIKKGMKRRTAKGMPMGGPRALGLEHSPTGYVLVAEEAPTIVRIFDEIYAGRAQRHIAQGLREDGVPTLEGGKWQQSTVGRIARNPLYKGMIHHNGEILPGTHAAIIPPAFWDQVNALMDSRARTSGGRGKGRPPVGRHLFRKGMLRHECGEALLPRTFKNKAKEDREVYICFAHMNDSADCPLPPISRAEIDLSMYRYFEEAALDIDATRRQMDEARTHKLEEARALLSQAERQQQAVEERLTRIRRDYMEDRLSAEDWAGFRDELNEGLVGAKAEVERLTGSLAQVESFGAFRDAEQDTLEKLAAIRLEIAGELAGSGSTDAIRAAMLRLFDHFVLRAPTVGETVHVDLVGRGSGLIIDPVVNQEAIERYEDSLPVFRRVPLYDAADKYALPFGFRL
jgi:DNA invertase Pin-like site-specific DNA recombinase